MLNIESCSRSSLSSQSQRRVLPEKKARRGALAGVVVCLTGLSADQKAQLHKIAEELGGRYARDLDTSETTHLIASAPEGAKYQTAASCNQIFIVSPEWLSACGDKGTRVDEEAYQLPSTPEREEISKPATTMVSLMESLENVRQRALFYPCHFFLIGFGSKESCDLNTKLCRFIRRARGTIYWQMNESITHLIVNEELNEEERDMARIVCLNHPNGPFQVSPLWILSSLKEQTLLPESNFFPRKQTSSKALESSRKKATKKRANARLFRGSLFALLRLTPPEGTVDFDSAEIENLISSHGGQLLSNKWLEALKADSNRDGCKRRTCYVVTWGGYTPSHVAVHPLLSQIKRQDLCNVVLATPIWVQTCIKDDKEISPSCNPLLFEPQSWPICRITSSNKKKGSDRAVRACVTGFVGSERTGLIYLLGAIGAAYTDNMKSSNTHLICKTGKGPKYEKAIEWGLHVVSVQWLSHIMQYGYNGADEGDSEHRNVGCENKFPFLDPTSSLCDAGDAPPKRKKRRMSTNHKKT